MPDDRIARILGDLGRPVEPDREFADRLFDRLVDEVDFGTGRARRHGLIPVRAGIRWNVPEAGRAWLVAALLLAAVLLAVLALIGSTLRDPTQLVLRSQDLYQDPPPFDMQVRTTIGSTTSNMATLRYRFDGKRLRIDDVWIVQTWMGSASTWLYDGSTFYTYDPGGKYLGRYAVVGSDAGLWGGAPPGAYPAAQGATGSPLGPLPLSWWSDQSADSTRFTSGIPPALACPHVQELGDENEAGRDAIHLRCLSASGGDVVRDVWLDRASLLVLRVTEGAASTEATDIDLSPSFAPGDMAVPVGPGGEQALGNGPLAPGRYFTPQFQPTLTMSLDAGWSNGIDSVDDAGIIGPPAIAGAGAPAFQLYVFRTDIVADPVTGKDVPFSGSTEDFIRWIRSHPGITVVDAKPVTIGDVPATAMDVVTSPTPPATFPCEHPVSAKCVFVTDIPGVGHSQLIVGRSETFAILTVHGRTVVIDVSGVTAEGRAAGLAALEHSFRFP